jgi:hypothetical protein
VKMAILSYFDIFGQVSNLSYIFPSECYILSEKFVQVVQLTLQPLLFPKMNILNTGGCFSPPARPLIKRYRITEITKRYNSPV